MRIGLCHRTLGHGNLAHCVAFCTGTVVRSRVSAFLLTVACWLPRAPTRREALERCLRTTDSIPEAILTGGPARGSFALPFLPTVSYWPPSGSKPDSFSGTWRAVKQQATLGDREGLILSLTFSPDGRTLAAGTGSGEIELWDVATGNDVRSCTDILAASMGWCMILTVGRSSPPEMTAPSGSGRRMFPSRHAQDPRTSI